MKRMSDEELLNLLSNPKDVEKIISALRKRKASSKAEKVEKHTSKRSLSEKEIPILHVYTCKTCGHIFQRTHLVKVIGREDDFPPLTKPVNLTTNRCYACFERLMNLPKETLVKRITGERYTPDCQIVANEREE
jgi:predicted Zn-ribbon and HTH transcriptional regulator